MRLAPLPVGSAPAFSDMREGVRELSEPTMPHRVFSCLEAELPPADAYRHCQAILSDTRALVISTYDGAVWEWTHADGSAL